MKTLELIASYRFHPWLPSFQLSVIFLRLVLDFPCAVAKRLQVNHKQWKNRVGIRKNDLRFIEFAFSWHEYRRIISCWKKARLENRWWLKSSIATAFPFHHRDISRFQSQIHNPPHTIHLHSELWSRILNARNEDWSRFRAWSYANAFALRCICRKQICQRPFDVFYTNRWIPWTPL